ncbi:MAG TPA: TerC family protein [Terriglobales bacterium]|nr:TerC family protein [Terriglobales bacterium]
MLPFWILFNAFVLGMLAADLWIFNRPAQQPSVRQALAWSATWIALAAAFALLVYFWQGRQSALEFTAGYVIELSLSVDNLFLFLIIFRYFQVPGEFQHRVLFWGIVGAIIARGIFIVLGVALIHTFRWMIYIFGAFLMWTGIKFFRQKVEVQPEANAVLRLVRRCIPITESYEGGRLFVRRGRLYATPLLIVLLVIETTDLLLAADSIPAVLAITLNTFIVYTSNVFAVLGLRSLFSVLSGMMGIFHYLHYGLSIILIFMGAKMLASDYYRIPTGVALAIVAGILLASILISVMHPKTAAT